MPPNPFARISEIRGLKNPRMPEMFFSATEEQIVEALVEMGYVKRVAEKEAAQFVQYRIGLTTTQEFDDEPDEEKAAPEEYQGFGASVRRIKEQETKGE